jgi:hypothetical protein
MLILIRVLFPTILTHPWKVPDKREQKRDKETTVVFAGSFNPPHWGHLVMIRYLAERYFHSCKQSDIICNPISLIMTIFVLLVLDMDL